MYPFLHLGKINIPLYGLMVLCGILLGLLIAVLRYRINGVAKDDVIYAFFYGLIGVFVGAKLLYILPRISQIANSGYDFLQALYILFSSGFVFYGGLIGGLVMIIIYSRVYKIPTWPLFDSLLPSIPLIHALGRVGCFFTGCCYGIPMDKPWGMLFNNSLVAPHNIPLFPVQLLEAGLNGIVFIVLFLLGRKSRKPGWLLGLYLSIYAVERFFLEYLRYDFIERGMIGPFSTSQWISVIMLPIGILLMILSEKYLQLPFFIRKNGQKS